MRKKTKPISILFIGNSFSYYHGLPKLVAHFAQISGSGNLVVDSAAKGGVTLKMLWHDSRTLKKLRNGKWDYVALQERGRLDGIVKRGVVHVGKPKTFIEYATRFHKEIEKAGATTILYCPPSFLGSGLPNDAKKLQAAYAILARKLHVVMVPSVTAFMLALKKRPDLNLYERDGYHPSPLGIYLIAVLFYKKLFRKKASDLPLISYVSTSARLPKNPKTVILSRTDAQFLWSIADKI